MISTKILRIKAINVLSNSTLNITDIQKWVKHCINIIQKKSYVFQCRLCIQIIGGHCKLNVSHDTVTLSFIIHTRSLLTVHQGYIPLLPGETHSSFNGQLSINCSNRIFPVEIACWIIRKPIFFVWHTGYSWQNLTLHFASNQGHSMIYSLPRLDSFCRPEHGSPSLIRSVITSYGFFVRSWWEAYYLKDNGKAQGIAITLLNLRMNASEP